MFLSKDFFLFIHSKDSQKTYLQSGAVRTNCLDCLDRTNFTQAHISKHVLKEVLTLIKKKQLESDPHTNVYDVESQKNDVLDSLKHMWDENGDKLSV